jgi:hypothetical protein
MPTCDNRCVYATLSVDSRYGVVRLTRNGLQEDVLFHNLNLNCSIVYGKIVSLLYEPEQNEGME